MLLSILVGSVVYHFQSLDFIPNDINDNEWIVGETQPDNNPEHRTTPVLLRNGKLINLAVSGSSGSACAINNPGHVLILSTPIKQYRTLKWHKPGFLYSGKRNCFLWANGKATYVGDVDFAGRLLDDDRFLARTGEQDAVVRVTNRQPATKLLPKIPSGNSEYKAHTYASDVNDSGTVVGGTDFGYDRSHAISIDPQGGVTDLHPNVEMHTNWSANCINAKGDIVGTHSLDSSIGGRMVSIWRNGKLTDLLSPEPWRYSCGVNGFNNRDQVVGSREWSNLDGPVEGVDPSKIKVTNIIHATLWSDGKTLDLNDISDTPKGYVLLSATKINNKGSIIGICIRDKVMSGFLLTQPSGMASREDAKNAKNGSHS